MNKFTNPYVRIQFYNSWFANNPLLNLTEEYENGVSMLYLSKISDIPVTIIRKDICMLFKWQSQLFSKELLLDHAYSLSFSNLITFPEEVLDVDEQIDCLYDEIQEGNYPDELENYILTGQLDTIPICLQNPATETLSNSKIKLWISPDEYESLKAYHILEQTAIPYEESFQIKDSYRYNQGYVNLPEKLLLINEAIENKTAIDLTYLRPGKKKYVHTIKPLKIVFDTSENIYTLLATTGKGITAFRLEYTMDISPCKIKIDGSSVEEQVDRIAHLVWGNSFENKPIGPVKIRFYNEGNVWEKVKREFANRDSSMLHVEGGYLYFEAPEIYGGNDGVNFLRWLRSFGSSAIIIQPKELRQRMIESYQKRIQ